MSLSASLNNALSGLTASSRSAQLVSSNVSNVMTDGYGRREIALASRILDGGGGGVQITGVNRVVDAGIVRDRRLADAALGFSQGRADFYGKLSQIVGDPEADQSLSGRLRLFEGALIEAASRPDSDTRLSAVLDAAQGLATELNTASDKIQEQRVEADRSIALQVETLNTALEQVRDINTQIAGLNGYGRDVSALLDQRQAVIDQISQIVSVKEVPRNDGKVALYTTGGGILLDHTAREVEFSPVNVITPDMTIESGALSGLSIDGQPMRVTGKYAPLGGGTLEAAFNVRDALAPAAQKELDAFARDIVARFEDPAVDSTTATGDPGLFTDNGAALDTASETGLAGRISVNAIADPAQGGELRRLRDGLGAVAAGDVGNSAQLQAFADAVAGTRAAASGPLAGSSFTLHTFAAEMVSGISAEIAASDRDVSFASSQRQTLKELELAGGVDTDQEMQKLLLIERAYGANARVVETIGTLIDQLLSI